MIGHFENVADATKAKEIIDALTEQVRADESSGRLIIGDPSERFSDAMLDLLGKLNIGSIGPSELEQFSYDINIKEQGNDLVLTTDELDISAFLKVMFQKGARVEVYSAHNCTLKHHTEEVDNGEASMTVLNWDIFTSLPGSVEKNFEQLCRGIVRQIFGSFGSFRALANQPGVEFHLKIDTRCEALGIRGVGGDGSANGMILRSTVRWVQLDDRKSRRVFEKRKPATSKLSPIWVLWTRRMRLTKDDQDWFNGLSSKMKLHLSNT